MLPGFRFLLVAIVFWMSILVFGLGATALLRTAHEVFASNPSWRTDPGTTFAERNETAPPVLAVLRVDPPIAEPKAPGQMPASLPLPESASTELAATESVSSAAKSTEINSRQTEGATLTAPGGDDLSVPEPAKPDIPSAEIPRHQETDTPPSAAMPAAADQTIIAAAEPSLEGADAPGPVERQAASAPSEQASASASPADTASTQTASLDPAPAGLGIQPQTSAANRNKASAKPDQSIAKKRLQARRAAYRRRMALLRARAARQVQQQPTNSFAPPFAQPTASATSP